MLNNLEKPKPTDEQVAILDAIRTRQGNILVNALAGSGKTSTIEMIVEELPPNEQPLYVAFNKAIVEEAQEKLPSYVEIRTLNSLGHRAWAQTCGNKVYVDTKNPKMPGIVREMLNAIKNKDDRQEAWDNYYDIIQAIGMSKHLGYIPDNTANCDRRLCERGMVQQRLDSNLSDYCWEIVDNALRTSIKLAYGGFIDFDDQVYMSAMFGGTFQRYSNVLVDEDQDLSPVNFKMLEKLVEGRVVGVGDRWQSIYAFRGAETHGVDKLKAMFEMVEMPLSISFRCPENVVKAVHWHVPHMKWLKPGGQHAILPSLDTSQIQDNSAIICRNNAPLFSAAFALLSTKRSVSVAGSDIGPRVIKLLQKIGRDGDDSDTLIQRIEEWREDKLRFANNIASINDTAECLKIFATWGADLWQAIKYAEHILKQQGSIMLTTGHKAKGKEWDTVYHLDPFLCRDDEQDRNLKYVITTRAKQTLYEIDGANIQWL
jgi:superfamily I DNA/RNA helicase